MAAASVARLRVARDDVAESTRRLLVLYSHQNTADESVPEYYVLKCCKQIQHLSMKGTTWSVSIGVNPPSSPEPIPQEMLIKMVRRHPTLRWLRSDLTVEKQCGHASEGKAGDYVRVRLTVLLWLF